MRPYIFAVVMTLAFGLFARTMSVMVRAAARGAPDARPRLDQIPRRIWSVMVYFVGQKKVAEEGPNHRTSKHHLLIFWGFLLITVGTAELMINGIFPSFTLDSLMPHFMYIGLKSAIDVLNLVVLLAICWAVFRRIVIRPALIPMNLDAAIILGAIAALMLTHFIYHGFYTRRGRGPCRRPGFQYSRQSAYR